jgi:hypothetical protein
MFENNSAQDWLGPGSLKRPDAMRHRSQRKFRSHVGAHEAVLANENWYGDGPPGLGKRFSASKTKERQTEVLKLALKAAKRAKAGNQQLEEAYFVLYDRLEACRPKRRCGSMACPLCARAFQRAKTAAQMQLISQLSKSQADKDLVLVTLIPKTMTYGPGQFAQMDIPKANRWLKDVLKQAGIDRVIVGSADLSWETRRGGKYLQLHWHLAMWTLDIDALKLKLKRKFQRVAKYERPVDVKVAADLKFLAYLNKVTKLPDLLRQARSQLPELLLALDKWDPVDLLVYSKVEISAQERGFGLRGIAEQKGRRGN